MYAIKQHIWQCLGSDLKKKKGFVLFSLLNQIRVTYGPEKKNKLAFAWSANTTPWEITKTLLLRKPQKKNPHAKFMEEREKVS